MQDEAKEVGIPTLDRLWFEEVMFHKLHSIVVFLRKRFLGLLHFFLVEILDDELADLGVVGYFERGMAAGASELDFNVSCDGKKHLSMLVAYVYCW